MSRYPRGNKKLEIDKFNAFFFDFDGVIVDSVNIKTEAFAQLYRPFGDEVVSKVVSHHTSHGGMSRFEKIHYYHRNYLNQEISKSDLSKLADRFSKLVIEKVATSPFIKGAIEFLELLKEKAKMLFIISATPEDEIKEIIRKRRLDRFFTDIKGSPANKIDNLKDLLGKYNLDVRTCLYFGDSEEDSNAASSLGMTFEPINYFDGETGYKNFFEFMNALEAR